MGLIVLKNDSALTTSILVSEGIGIEHRAILELIRKYKDRKIFQTFTVQPEKMATKGRSGEFYYLTENQAMFLITLMKNSEKVLDFKESLVNAFVEYRNLAQKLLAQKNNIEWIETRKETKVMRRECTDIIQKFILYAKEQGSKSADKYYMNFSRMEVTGLFILEQKYPNARDVMSIRQLRLVEMADEAIAISLQDSMNKNIPYKECFQIAKDKICSLAKIFPKSPLPVLLGHDK